jgi:hypothetical protein
MEAFRRPEKQKSEDASAIFESGGAVVSMCVADGVGEYSAGKRM